jgi:hypothetical protein
MKTGRYAGEVREFPFATARDLIANDRATRYQFGSEMAGHGGIVQVLKRMPAESVDTTPAPKKKKAKGSKNGRT